MSGLSSAAKAKAAEAARRVFGDFPVTDGVGTGRKFLKRVNRGPGVLKYTPPQLNDFKFAGVPHAKAIFQYDYKQYLKGQGDPKYEKLKERDGFHPDVHDAYKVQALNVSREEHPVGVAELLPEEGAAFTASAEKGALQSAVSLVGGIVARLQAASEAAEGDVASSIEGLLTQQQARLETLQAQLEALPEGEEEEDAGMAAAVAAVASVDPTAVMGPAAVDYSAFPAYTMYSIARQYLGAAGTAATDSAAAQRGAGASSTSAPEAGAALDQFFHTVVPAPLHLLSLPSPGALPVLPPPTAADLAAVAAAAPSPDLTAALTKAVEASEPSAVAAAVAALEAAEAAASDPSGVGAAGPTLLSAALLRTFTTWLSAVRPGEGGAPLDLATYVPGVHSDVGTLELPLSALGTDDAALPALLGALLSDATPFAQDERELAGLPTGAMVEEGDVALEEVLAGVAVEGGADPWASAAAMQAAAAAGGVSALPPSLRTVLRVRVVDHLMAAVAVLQGEAWSGADTLGVGAGLTPEAAAERVQHFTSWLVQWSAQAEAARPQARVAMVLAVQEWVGAATALVEAAEAEEEAPAPLLPTREAVREAGMRRLTALWRSVHYTTSANALDAYAASIVGAGEHPVLSEADLQGTAAGDILARA